MKTSTDIEKGSVIRVDNKYFVTNGDELFCLKRGKVEVIAFKNLQDKEWEVIDIDSPEANLPEVVLSRAKKTRITPNMTWTCSEDWIDYLVYNKKTYVYKVYGRTFSLNDNRHRFDFCSRDMEAVFSDITRTTDELNENTLKQTVFSKTRLPKSGDHIAYFLEHNALFNSEKNGLLFPLINRKGEIKDNIIESLVQEYGLERIGNEVFFPIVPYVKHGVYLNDQHVLFLENEAGTLKLKDKTLLEFISNKTNDSLLEKKKNISTRAFIIEEENISKENPADYFEDRDRLNNHVRIINEIIKKKIIKAPKEPYEFIYNYRCYSPYMDIFNALFIEADYKSNSEDYGNNYYYSIEGKTYEDEDSPSYWTDGIYKSIQVVEQSWRLNKFINIVSPKISKKYIAEKLNKSTQTIYNWFNGDIACPLDYETICSIANILNISPLFLYLGVNLNIDSNNEPIYEVKDLLKTKDYDEETRELLKSYIFRYYKRYFYISNSSLFVSTLCQYEKKLNEIKKSFAIDYERKLAFDFFELKISNIELIDNQIETTEITPVQSIVLSKNDPIFEIRNSLIAVKCPDNRLFPMISKNDILILDTREDQKLLTKDNAGNAFLLISNGVTFMSFVLYDGPANKFYLKIINNYYDHTSKIKFEDLRDNLCVVGKCIKVIKSNIHLYSEDIFMMVPTSDLTPLNKNKRISTKRFAGKKS
ncbi:helix-turn-helix domain-containing protein [Succinivibrio dextrinosolvens]|uniref:helix-turn-helix domain-containing protein n=1 Tax=Succinivibrio dextrinosolvens TaxID=83771 RepID=UPI001920E548|nr:helix-turn-helix transcriptional regulator [Succinivibrio dextrinosolvens]